MPGRHPHMRPWKIPEWVNFIGNWIFYSVMTACLGLVVYTLGIGVERFLIPRLTETVVQCGLAAATIGLIMTINMKGLRS